MKKIMIRKNKKTKKQQDVDEESFNNISFLLRCIKKTSIISLVMAESGQSSANAHNGPNLLRI